MKSKIYNRLSRCRDVLKSMYVSSFFKLIGRVGSRRVDFLFLVGGCVKAFIGKVLRMVV